MADSISRRDFMGLTIGGVTAGLAASPMEAVGASAKDAGLPPKTTIDAPPLRPAPDWVWTHFRIAHLPPPSWDMIEAHLKAGVTSLTVNMDSRWSKVGPSAPLYKPEVVKEADEMMRRYVERVHAAGAKALFYMGPVHVPVWNPEFRAAHPDWLVRRSNGDSGELASWRTAYGDWLVEQLAYVVRTYGNDGFWFDGYSGWTYSYDETSRQLFRESSGGSEIPEKIDPRDPLGMQYTRWYWKGYVDFADRVRGAIRKENPEAVIFANYSACREWYQPNSPVIEYPACYANAVDLPSIEQYWDNPGDAINQQFISAFTAGVTHNRGASVWAQPQAFGITGLSPEVEFRLRYLTSATWGIYTEYVESTGREDYVGMWIRDMKAREKWMHRSQPVPWIGIVASEQTKLLYGGESSLTKYFSHTLGAFRSLFEAHCPIGVLTEYDIEDDNLGGCKVLVLPNVACLSDRAAEVIRRFVHAGGGLVATFETSLYDHTGTKRANFALSDLFGADYDSIVPVSAREEAIPLYVAGSHEITNDPVIDKAKWTAWTPPKESTYAHLMMVASAVKTRGVRNAGPIVNFREKTESPTTFPAALVSRVGRGRVVYFPAAVDKAMFFYPIGYLRRLLINACTWAAGGPPPVEVKAPLILATTFRAQPEEGRIVVHLLNDASSWGRHSIYQKISPQSAELRDPGHPQSPDLRGTWPVREEVIPIHDVKVTCRKPGITRATLVPEGLKLHLKPVPGGVEATVPKVELHSMVVFE